METCLLSSAPETASSFLLLNQLLEILFQLLTEPSLKKKNLAEQMRHFTALHLNILSCWNWC